LIKVVDWHNAVEECGNRAGEKGIGKANSSRLRVKEDFASSWVGRIEEREREHDMDQRRRALCPGVIPRWVRCQ
jgi:hypothetical protein